MKPGRGKPKGSAYERKICQALSMWVSHGKDPDLFWRSAISGGRATVAKRKGRSIKPAGDICAVSPVGHHFTDRYFVECKAYKNLDLDSFFFGTGKLAKFWQKCVEQARDHDRIPFLIAKQNFYPAFVLVPVEHQFKDVPVVALLRGAAIYKLDDLLRSKWKPGPLVRIKA